MRQLLGSYIGLFLLDAGSRGSKSEIYFEDFKTSRIVLFLHFTFLIRASNVVKT